MSATEMPQEPSKRKHTDLTQGPVLQSLMRLVVPMIIGIVAIMSQPIVDTYFVGLLGTRELAAMAYIFPIAFIISSILIGIGAGATAILSRLVGAQKWDEVKQTTTHTLVLAALTVITATIILFFAINSIFQLLGASKSLLPLIREYMDIFLFGLIAMAPTMIGSSALRAKGEVKLSSAIMILAAIGNAVLDPIFIFGWGIVPEMGFGGAALASVCSNIIASMVVLWFLFGPEDMLGLKLGTRAHILADWKAVMHVGGPAALTNCISPFSAAMLVFIVSRFGEEAVAAWGVASRIEMLAIIVPLALSGCIGPFVGQNMGAGKIDRMREAMRISYLIGALYSLATFALLAVFARQAAGIFDDNPAVADFAASYLVAVPASYPLYAILMVTTAAFNALGLPRPNMVLYTLKLLVIYLPLAWLGAQYYGFAGVIWASILSNVIPGVLALVWYKAQFPRRRAEEEALAPV